MTPTQPFSASEFHREPDEKRTIYDWGIWFDDGKTQDWVFDNDDLMEGQAIRVATLLNKEWSSRGKVWQAYQEESGYYERISEVVYQIK